MINIEFCIEISYNLVVFISGSRGNCRFVLIFMCSCRWRLRWGRGEGEGWGMRGLRGGVFLGVLEFLKVFSRCFICLGDRHERFWHLLE